MEVAFDGKTKRAAHVHDLGKAHETELWAAEAKVTEAEQPIRFVRVAFRKKPSRVGIWGEQLANGFMVALVRKRIDQKPDTVFDSEKICRCHQRAVDWLERGA